MERIESKTVFDGLIAHVRRERWLHADGSIAEREVVGHPGAVAIVPYDDEYLYLVRQPREAVGEEALLEIPAGKLDVEGESKLDCARRELIEEIGMEASEWERVRSFYPTPGLAEEETTIFFAGGLSPVADHAPDPDERIELVRWPRERLDEAIAESRDAKTLVGLLLFRERGG